MSNLANQEYTNDQLLVGTMLLHVILQKISEEPKLKFDAFDLRADKKKNRHIFVISELGTKWEKGTTLFDTEGQFSREEFGLVAD